MVVVKRVMKIMVQVLLKRVHIALAMELQMLVDQLVRVRMEIVAAPDHHTHREAAI